jgi:hypothetical protein
MFTSLRLEEKVETSGDFAVETSYSNSCSQHQQKIHTGIVLGIPGIAAGAVC